MAMTSAQPRWGPPQTAEGHRAEPDSRHFGARDRIAVRGPRNFDAPVRVDFDMKLAALTRRQALKQAGRTGAAGALALALPPWLVKAGGAAALAPSRQATLRAAVARIVPASGPGDWSAADVGADNYILTLLSGTARIYAGGPYRSRFARFQTLSRIKRVGWRREAFSRETCDGG